MAYQIWRVGLDIQNGCLRALAVQRRRYGWQLRQWWQLRLPDDTLRGGSLHYPDRLCEVLLHWRKQLPRAISLRVGFPVQRILQQNMPLPDRRLREPERSWYIETMAARLFPVSGESLTFDYREESGSLRVTAAWRQELDLWLGCLRQAGLTPDAVDIMPCALRGMAQSAGLAQEGILVHELTEGWLWTTSWGQPLQFGMLYRDEIRHLADALRQVVAQCPMSVSQPIYYSSAAEHGAPPAPGEAVLWSPLSAFSQLQPPLPERPGAFVLAGGLALRPGDA
ncbi:pilus assembly protein HofM [Affinibrenneria salicis]|uniref:Pilus assembly protein HofM n=1 Tax=Affinibrenneria salicis TaxID=2590031 RepID=A0A5J5FTB3_9GAMM|nr:pilus assembly protein PilM [Affinibrenneria salicis]KAA8996374.1 pilus assembly protein HofM [Affinibrenneria salicis]